MPVFEFIAIDDSRAKKQGLWSANSARQARDELRLDGLQVVSIKEQATQGHRGYGSIRRVKSPLSATPSNAPQLTGFVTELATMLSVNIPILDALDTQISQARGKFKNALMLLKDEIATGTSLANAMRKQTGTFDCLTISMIEVGETSGNLDSVLARLGEFKQKAGQFKDKVVSALMYPAIVVSVAFGVAIFIMTYVVPSLLNDLAATGKSLPWPTAVLKTVSDSLLRFGWIYSIAIFVVLFALIAWSRTPHGRRLKCRLILAIPLLGKVTVMQELSRIGLVISTLMRSGIPFLTATDIASKTTNHVLLAEQLKDCICAMESGKGIGETLRDQSFFPPLFVHVMTVGQQSGRLEEMLDKIADDYNRQVALVSSRFSMMLEPILILGLSAFIGFLLFATMLPILEASNVY